MAAHLGSLELIFVVTDCPAAGLPLPHTPPLPSPLWAYGPLRAHGQGIRSRGDSCFCFKGPAGWGEGLGVRSQGRSKVSYLVVSGRVVWPKGFSMCLINTK